MPRDANGEKVTIREVYQLIDSKVGAIDRSLERLESKFDVLESGRLSNLEKEVANITGRIMIIPILVSIAISVFSFVVNYIFRNN